MTILISDITWTLSSSNIISSRSGSSPNIIATISKVEWTLTGSYTESETLYSFSQSGITYNNPTENKITISSGSTLTNEIILEWLELVEPELLSAKRNIFNQLKSEVNFGAISSVSSSITSLSSSITSLEIKINEIITAVNTIDGITNIELL